MAGPERSAAEGFYVGFLFSRRRHDDAPMSFPPRIVVRGGNLILLCEVARYVARVSLVSTLLRL